MKSWNEMKSLMFDEDPLLIFARAGEMEGIKRSVNVMNLEKRDRKGYTPLMLSAMKGHLEGVNYFLMLNADIHVRDNHGNSVLMAAVFHGHYSVVKLLLEHGADPDVINYKKQTAILFARTFGHQAIERILTEKLTTTNFS